MTQEEKAKIENKERKIAKKKKAEGQEHAKEAEGHKAHEHKEAAAHAPAHAQHTPVHAATQNAPAHAQGHAPFHAPAHAASHAPTHAPSHAATAHVPKEDKKEEKKPAKKRAKKSSAVIERGKRKESVARATIRKGHGTVRVNSRISTSYFNNKYLAEIAREPLYYIGDKSKDIDVSISVYGGGIVGQAQATRTAIANALVSFFPDDNLKDKFLGIDKSLIIEDSRRVEAKKYKGPKARARYQKSYR